MANHRRQTGFSLLEILIVVVVVAIAGGMVMSTIPSGITPQQQLSQSRELSSYLRLQREVAVMTGYSYGLRLTEEAVEDEIDAYRYHGEWFVLDVENGDVSWLPSERVKPFTIKRGYLLRLAIDEQPLVLPDYNAEAAEDRDDGEERDEEVKSEDGPQLLFLSSGELNGFTIELCRDPKQPICHRIEGSYLGRISLEDGSEEDDES
ncbi:type II secretion system protein H (GspH) [Sinobacterium caligoides]|uniref:Type II secretion system protein H n=1 Tax=Sinobacterium caligoides TaxID=933926 RepID=A0A3N2DNF8_9GAMM|nr:GspH/FimT family pseudopilin [Sinobacterium caligoides]ROS01346.1 type II secretion system protein H (GspH) [Sinobacterium caligoides]